MTEEPPLRRIREWKDWTEAFRPVKLGTEDYGVIGDRKGPRTRTATPGLAPPRPYLGQRESPIGRTYPKNRSCPQITTRSALPSLAEENPAPYPLDSPVALGQMPSPSPSHG